MVRRFLGPVEVPVSRYYRSVFINLDRLVAELVELGTPGRLLELGCGEGLLTELLVRAFPASEITAIDITPAVGRLFRGDLSRVKFQQKTIQELAQEKAKYFDFILINDVLHHVPRDQWNDFLACAKNVCKVGGMVCVKDWVRYSTPIHWACHFLDRYVTGDKVYYASEEELCAVVTEIFGENALVSQVHVAPWRNNLGFLLST
jgi:2-polyprenyl-6-hydroxyphenyl methylase/3-demethylubiquinone-9 3-methyltransferase